MKKVKAQIHSINAIDEATIVSENGCNNVIAEYKGKQYTAIFNVFNGLYYVDNVYGEIKTAGA